MIELKAYQKDAVEALAKDTYRLLRTPGGRHKMVFKAPTGAGKTVVMAAYLNRLCEELPERFDLSRRELAFIWIAPNQLHLQSFNALRQYFAELRSIKPIQFEDVTDGYLKPNEVLFLNWQSINKDGNLYIRANESDKTLVQYINRSRLHDVEIVVILDEAHLFAGRGQAAQNLLQQLYAKIEIDVSATPLFRADYGYTIRRPDVVDAEMIKRGVILNPGLDAHEQHGRTLNQVLMELALEKRNAIAEAYRRLGVPVNPLLLIQLPNDTQAESALDKQIKEEVLAWYAVQGITTQNHRMAVWLSNSKENLEAIEAPDSIVDVLLFKQAIALGWDCPRAAVLLIFRELHSETFTIQTVGRILRMPQQRHYPEHLLNYGYVFTNLSKQNIAIVQDDMDYISRNKAIRRQGYQSIALKSQFINTRLTRNRLGSKFRKCLYEAAEAFFNVTNDPGVSGQESIYYYNARQMAGKFIEMDVDNIDIPIPRDLHLVPELGVTQVGQMERFAKTQSELDTLFRQFCRDHVGAYAKTDSSPVLELALKMLFEEYLGMNEFQAVKIVLYEQNRPRFVELIDQALHRHEQILAQKAASASKKVEESAWEVPPERMYNEDYDERDWPGFVMEPPFEYHNASSPEKSFARFLEMHQAHIEWWYKNGDKNKEDFAVTYTDREGVTRGFYVDFIIRLKNGTLALFDTKTPGSDPEFCNKHNALHAFIQQERSKGVNLLGGVIVPKEDNVWKYCDNPITSSYDLTGWISFDPALANG